MAGSGARERRRAPRKRDLRRHRRRRDGAVDEGCADADADGRSDRADNCPATLNADQSDADRDGLADASEGPGTVVPAVLGTGEAGTTPAWSAAPDVPGYNV